MYTPTTTKAHKKNNNTKSMKIAATTTHSAITSSENELLFIILEVQLKLKAYQSFLSCNVVSHNTNKLKPTGGEEG